MRQQSRPSITRQAVISKGLSKIYDRFSSLSDNDPLSKKLINSYTLNVNKVYNDMLNNTTSENGIKCFLGIIKIISTICMTTDDDVIMSTLEKYTFVCQTKDIFLIMRDRWVDTGKLTFESEIEKQEVKDFFSLGYKVFTTITKKQYSEVVKYIDNECKRNGIEIQYGYNV